MLNLSAVAVLEKNKLSSDGAWLVLLEISFSGQTNSIRVVRDTKPIDWDGHTWVPFPFELDDVKEDSKGELPSVSIKVSNVTRYLQTYLEDNAVKGGVGASVILRVIHSNFKDVTKAELEEVFTVQHVTADSQWVTFELGSDTPLSLRYPNRRILKDFCPFSYGGIECGISPTSEYPTCNKTRDNCEKRGNSKRFGGEPSIPQGGLYASNRF